MVKLNKYNDFLNESKLELLLEANISYNNEFVKILKTIDSTIAKKVLSLAGKEIDVNTNYININKDVEENDIVSFVNDDKVKELPIKVLNKGRSYSSLSDIFSHNGIIGNKVLPEDGDIGNIIKEITHEDLKKLAPSVNWESRYEDGLRIVQFRTSKGDILIDKSGLEKSTDEVSKSDIKIGRLVRRLLDKAGEKFTDVEIEDFVTKYKSKIALLKNVMDRFDIVKGEDIRKFYHVGRYESISGTLGNSCMMHDKCQDYLDIYTENKNVELVIFMSLEKEGKISGRALLWTDIEGRKFMDRVYVIKHEDTELFIEYAIKNDFYYKAVQNSHENFTLMKNRKSSINNSIIVETTKFDHLEYPYMDTLAYYDPTSGILTNFTKNIKNNFYYELDSTSGNRSKYFKARL